METEFLQVEGVRPEAREARRGPNKGHLDPMISRNLWTKTKIRLVCSISLYQLLTGVDFALSVLSYMVAMAMAIYRSYIGHIWAIHKLYISHVQPTVQATDGP